MIDMTQVQVPGRLIGPHGELIVTVASNPPLSEDAKTVIQYHLRTCLNELLLSRDFEAARYVIAISERLELNKG